MVHHKKWYSLVLILVFIFPLCIFGCKKYEKEPQLKSSFCSVPISVNCGTWTLINENNQFLIQNTPEVILPLTNSIDCESNSGLIKIPSLLNDMTLEFGVFLNCTFTNNQCVCSGNSYRPGNQMMTISGQYLLRLSCDDKNNNLRQVYEDINEC